MKLSYTDEMKQRFPERITGTLQLTSFINGGDFTPPINQFYRIATNRLCLAHEGEWPEIQAWRKAFTKMKLKPTQYRCAAEALLRRFRKEGELPQINPLIDLCNAISLAFGIPIAVFDLDCVSGDLMVRHARGNEVYQPFSGDIEYPDKGEVIFSDDADRAHARRWTNRQSGYSAIDHGSTTILIVAEAMHSTAQNDIPHLLDTLQGVLNNATSHPTIVRGRC
ncbi:phenylalanine--tRNA ligase beta subunit-related protein [Prodigiosinella aquatilis]|nr:phenylalanine--tRNA ligase beta subunit-related protein [Prodigiosinella sp. LS101]WJV52984.1 phenylalanine--tRNA ligase beta subunit-related protein [Prodigiosinella sp. LS101]WJV57340.1 phenylalanine--tRNA ligase beta subunit-related protein [Pectobacteriaceae bacterium C111]